MKDNLKEKLMKDLNEDEVNFALSILTSTLKEIEEKIEKQMQELPPIKWRDEHEGNLVKASHNNALSLAQQIIKEHKNQ